MAKIIPIVRSSLQNEIQPSIEIGIQDFANAIEVCRNKHEWRTSSFFWDCVVREASGDYTAYIPHDQREHLRDWIKENAVLLVSTGRIEEYEELDTLLKLL